MAYEVAAEAASAADGVVAEAASAADEVVAKALSSANEVVAEAASAADKVVANAASLADETRLEAAFAANEVMALLLVCIFQLSVSFEIVLFYGMGSSPCLPWQSWLCLRLFFPCFTLCRRRAVDRRVVWVHAWEDKGTNKGAKGGTTEDRMKRNKTNNGANERMNKGTGR